MENNTNQNFDTKYELKSEIDHIISRSGMWIGSNANEVINYPLFVPSKNKILFLPNVSYNSGLLKLVDEVLSNSIDEYRRKESLFQITEIEVEANINGSIVIKDDGGIPVQMHKSTGILIPELIFGHLRTSSNYDDSQEREVVGTNGLGAKLSNVFSRKFVVQTCDAKNSVCIEWSNNMRESNKDLDKYPGTGFLIKKDNSYHGTKISFELDLERFMLEDLDLATIRILQKRCIDAAAANPGLKIKFRSDIAQGKLDSDWIFSTFEEYVDLYINDKLAADLITYKNKRDTIIIVPENIGFNFGFVNGAVCSEGTHIKKIEKQLTTSILEYCQKHEMELLVERDITNRMSIFVNTVIVNPTYDSQSKKTLTNRIDKFILNFTREFLDSLNESAFMQALKDYYEIKYLEIKKKELKKLNGLLKSTPTKKLISCVSKDINRNELWLFEGNSASNGFRKSRNLFQSAYLLRGKITNTFNLNKNQIVENIELREVIASLGILFGEPAKNVKNCKFNKIIFATDMDVDGNHIAGLLIAFFGKHFPELIKAGRIYRALSPIIVCSKKGQSKKYFHTLEQFSVEEHSLKGWEIIYTKGLGGLDDIDYKIMVRQQKLIQFVYENEEDMDSIGVWFDKATNMRKELLLIDSGEIE
jgi:DNA topoisomerase-2